VTISRLPHKLSIGAAAAGVAAWAIYFQQGLVLSHYDAKAHLVVARRVIDNMTPGWQQLGAVWLPLPHLIQILPTQIDLFYRTGASGSLVSILSFSVLTWAATSLVLRMTGSELAAITTAALLVLNPNLLYLQSTPMSEPMLLASVAVVVLWMHEWLQLRGPFPSKLGWAMFAAAWTRYEAWPIIASCVVVAALVQWRRGEPAAAMVRQLGAAIAWPAAAVLLFVLNSRITVGSWFVSGGFYELDPTYDGLVWRSLVAVWWGTHRLSGYAIESVGLVAAAWLTYRALVHREGSMLLPLTLFTAAVLPFYAFYEGHPFRIRYMVPTVVASVLCCGLAAGFLRPWRSRTFAAVLVASSLVESPPFGRHAPLVEEAQWDVPHSLERRAVTACLAPRYRGEKVMASMGSLAHYMQELSQEGFAISDFLHEGNGGLWELALETGPAPHVGWMLIEEQSEGGDVLARRLRDDAAFTRGMERMCEGGGVALYRRE
jgi:hypothetical protein